MELSGSPDGDFGIGRVHHDVIASDVVGFDLPASFFDARLAPFSSSERASCKVILLRCESLACRPVGWIERTSPPWHRGLTFAIAKATLRAGYILVNRVESWPAD